VDQAGRLKELGAGEREAEASGSGVEDNLVLKDIASGNF